MTTTTHHSPPQTQARPRLRPVRGSNLNALVLVAGWLAVIVVAASYRSDFLSQRTMLAVGFTMAVTGMLATGAAIVMASGALVDLSVPAALLFPAWATSTLLDRATPWPTAVVVAFGIAVGVAWGLLNAAIVAAAKINPLIVTIGTNFIGIAVLTTRFSTAAIPARAGLRGFANGNHAGVPNIWWVMLGTILAAAVFLARTRAGRHLLAVGGSVPAARSRGISIVRIRFLAFGVAGACYGLAGVLFAGSTSGFTPTDSASYLGAVIAAVIMAGVSLSGGQGNPLMLIPALGLLATVQTALVFFGLSTSWKLVFQGGVLVAALAGDGYLRRRATR